MGMGEPARLLEMFCILTLEVIMQAYTHVKIIQVCMSGRYYSWYVSYISIKV